MNKVLSDAIKHYKAKAALYRQLAEKAEAEVARLEALAKQLDPRHPAADQPDAAREETTERT